MRRHARSLVRLIRRTTPNPLIGCEIGVWRGHTSEGLLLSFPLMKFIGIDPWDSSIPNDTMPKTQAELSAAEAEYLRRTEFAADRRITMKMKSVEAAGKVSDESLDWIFIDGIHDRENLERDIPAWWPKVKSGGLFSGHDYDGRGDRIGLFCVKPVVDEFAVSFGLTVNVAPGDVWWWIKPGGDA